MSWARNSVGERGDNIGLPDVTTADNGKIMEVESGEWKLKEGSGGGGGSELPEVTADDNGDVLTVVDGAWAKAEPSGGLPPATTSDYGKVLTLQKAVATTADIVPQQTVTVTNPSDSYPLTNVNTSLVAEGVECTVTIDDATETGVIDDEWYLVTDTITIDFNNSLIEIPTAGTYTIKVTTPSSYKAEPAWVAGEYPGWDVVIFLNRAELGNATTATLVKGDYAELQRKALAKELITYAVYGANNDETEPYTTTFSVLRAYYNTYVDGDPEFWINVADVNKVEIVYVSNTSGGSATTKRIILTSTNFDSVTRLERMLILRSDNTVSFEM